MFDNAPIETVIPAEGAITMPLVMALVKGAPRPIKAKKYLDWLLDEEAQKLMADAFFRPVMNVDLPGDLQAKFPPAQAYANTLRAASCRDGSKRQIPIKEHQQEEGEESKVTFNRQRYYQAATFRYPNF